MEITYVGHSCFKIKGKQLSLVIDPYDPKIGYKLPKLDAEVVLISHDHYDHSNIQGVSNTKFTVDTAGEYEVSGVLINALPTFHDDKQGAKRGKNLAFLIDIDGFSILHLGDLGHELSDSTLEHIGTVDLLMIPVGGFYTIDAETATKVISSIEPGIVIPMHYGTKDLTGVENLDTLDKFLDQMGAEGVKTEEKLKITNKSDIPDETQIVVLSPTH